jgi:hypothetical protein
MSEQAATELAQCLLDDGLAIAHSATREAAALLDRQSPYSPYAAERRTEP